MWCHTQLISLVGEGFGLLDVIPDLCPCLDELRVGSQGLATGVDIYLLAHLVKVQVTITVFVEMRHDFRRVLERERATGFGPSENGEHLLRRNRAARVRVENFEGGPNLLGCGIAVRNSRCPEAGHAHECDDCYHDTSHYTILYAIEREAHENILKISSILGK